MRVRLTSLFLVVSLLSGLLPTGAAAGRVSDGVIEIGTMSALLEHLGGGDTAGKTYSLTADLDLSGRTWTPLGGPSGFQGLLLGNGHTLSGLAISAALSPEESAGLFGIIAPDGAVQDLVVSGSLTVAGSNGYAGGIAGTCRGTLTNCVFLGDVAVSSLDCAVGGVVGALEGTAQDCGYRGDLTAREGNRLGGLAGSVLASGVLANSYALGKVRQQGGSGGYVGGVAGSSNGAIRACVQSGLVGLGQAAEYSYAGGIAGGAAVGSVFERCFWQAGYQSEAVGTGGGAGDCATFSTGDEVLDILNAWAAENGARSWVPEDGLPTHALPAPPTEPQGPTILTQPQSTETIYGESAMLTLTAEGADLTYQWYGGTPETPIPGADEPAFLLPASGVGVHLYRCAVTDGEGQTVWSDSAAVTVSPRPLTVTAEDVLVFPGDAPPAFAVRYDGFAPGETAAVLGGVLDFTCAAGPDSPAGTYPITPGGLTAEHYAISYIPGTLTVSALAEAPVDSVVLPPPDGAAGWYVNPFTALPAPGYAMSGSLSGPFSPGGVTFSADTADGSAQVYLKDSSGVKYVSVITYRLDTSAPILSWSGDGSILEEECWHSSALVEIEAEDSLSGVENTVFSLSNDAGISRNIAQPLLLDQPGTYTVEAIATDRAGNRTVLSRVFRIEPAIAELVDRVETLDDTSSFAAVETVRAWYSTLGEERQERAVSAESGAAALARLEEIEAGHARVKALIASAAAVSRPLAPEARPGGEALLSALQALGELRVLLPPDTLSACESLTLLLSAVADAEDASHCLPDHPPGPDCAAAGDGSSHRALVEAAVRAWDALTAEGRTIASPGAYRTVEAQYTALLERLNCRSTDGGITIHGLTDRVDTSALESAYPGHEIRLSVSAVPGLPEADLSAAEAELLLEEPELTRVSSQDVRLMAEAVEGDRVLERTEVQPRAGETVALRLPIPPGARAESVRVLHVHGGAADILTPQRHNLQIVTENGTSLLLFQVDRLSHFIVYAVTDSEPEKPPEEKPEEKPEVPPEEKPEEKPETPPEEKPEVPPAAQPDGGSATETRYYTVTAAATAGGTVSPASARVARGGSAVFTLLPDPGYRLSSLLLDGTAVMVDGGSFTLQNIRTNHTLEARFVRVWSDTAGHWGASDIDYVTECGLMVGTEGGRFRPDAALTRGEAAELLFRLSGGSDGEDALAWAAAEGLLRGDGDGLHPERTVTRQELAVLLYRYALRAGNTPAALMEPETTPSDWSEVAPWATEAALFCLRAGVITGRPGNRFAPRDAVTRAEAAAMLRRFCEQLTCSGTA